MLAVIRGKPILFCLSRVSKDSRKESLPKKCEAPGLQLSPGLSVLSASSYHSLSPLCYLVPSPSPPDPRDGRIQKLSWANQLTTLRKVKEKERDGEWWRERKIMNERLDSIEQISLSYVFSDFHMPTGFPLGFWEKKPCCFSSSSSSSFSSSFLDVYRSWLNSPIQGDFSHLTFHWSGKNRFNFPATHFTDGFH